MCYYSCGERNEQLQVCLIFCFLYCLESMAAAIILALGARYLNWPKRQGQPYDLYDKPPVRAPC